jgi:hypothetical protein
MPRQSKFDKILPRFLAADWVERHHWFSWMKKLSDMAHRTVLMLPSCQSYLSDSLVAHPSATLLWFHLSAILLSLMPPRASNG